VARKTNSSPQTSWNRKPWEKWAIILSAISFITITGLQIYYTKKSQLTPENILNNILYFFLLNLNVILFILFFFLLTRHVVKTFFEKKSTKIGSGLKWKILSSLLLFTVIPSTLLFVGSTYIIKEGINRWFSNSVTKTLRSAESVANEFYQQKISNLKFYSKKISPKISNNSNSLQQKINSLREQYPINMIEVYKENKPPIRSIDKTSDLNKVEVPLLSFELQDKIKKDKSKINILGLPNGDLIQHIYYKNSMTVVVSQFIDTTLKSDVNNLKTKYSKFKTIYSFKDKLQTNYILILFTLFLLTLFAILWFGIYLAKSLTDPIIELINATKIFSNETSWDDPEKINKYLNLTDVEPKKQTADLALLKHSFAKMAKEVSQRGKKITFQNEELKNAVHSLQERENYLETILSSIRRGVVLVSPNGNIIRINNEALKYFKIIFKNDLLIENVINSKWENLVKSKSEKSQIITWLDKIKKQSGEKIDQIFNFNYGKGRALTQVSLRVTGIWVIDKNKSEYGWLIILEDVTQSSRLERLTAWQEVARRVAHEIKNPLTPIQLSADRMEKQLANKFSSNPREEKIFSSSINQIRKQTLVIKNLVKEFSEFAKLPEPKFTSTDIDKLLNEWSQDFKDLNNQVSINYLCAPSAKPILLIDKEYIRRLFFNIVDNAWQSMSEGNTKNPSITIKINDNPQDNESILLTFEDNGPGIPEAMMDKIFDPYVSSKSSGLGLGLPIVRRIVLEHKGKIWIEKSNKTQGAKFVISLPRYIS